MAHHTIEYDEQCKSCGGTGLFIGMAERDGAAIVCHTCEGTGCHHVKIEYNDFEGIQSRSDVKHVFENNPGICLGNSKGEKIPFTLKDFGGMPYRDWVDGLKFPKNSENRRRTCPCWWYQCADYKKKPEWDECMKSLGWTFSKCPHFENKVQCWDRWDKEFGTA